MGESQSLTLSDEIYEFLSNFRDENGRYRYREQVRDILAYEVKTYRIYFDDLKYSNINLAREFMEHPYDTLDAAKDAVLRLASVEKPLEAEKLSKDDIYVEIVGDDVGYTVKLRDISSKYIGKLITVRGLLVKVSQIYSIPTIAVYQCPGYREPIRFVRKRISEGLEPENILGKSIKIKQCKLVKEETKFTDIQYARIQERPDELPPGQIPRFLDVILEKPLIDKAYPGDFVKIIGVLDIIPREGKRRTEEYEFRLIANHIESKGKEAFEVRLSRNDEKEIRKKASEPGFYQKLIRSFAPSIYGYDDIKEALLLSLIGGEDKILPDGTRIRGRIHILLVGDPGVAKSQLLKYVAMVAPKGIYTSGRGSTAAGLTAAVLKEAGGGMSLEAGAVVLADMGVCAIDEIDKMRPEDRVALHEAMEQQTVSISKGGIIATLNARTTIIAAANPVDGVYNPYKPLVENVNLPVTLLSRFDLILLVRDEFNEEKDRRLIEHMIKARTSGEPYRDTFDIDFLRKFIAYASKIRVELTDEASKELMNYFMNMRRIASTSEESKVVPITPRQFEALIRLAEASAKAHLRDKVSVEDAKIAIKLMDLYLRSAALDVSTQQPDVSIIMTGVPAKRASKLATVLNVLRMLEKERGGEPVSEDEWIEKVITTTHIKDTNEIIEIIEKLKNASIIYEPTPGHYKTVRGATL